MSTNTSALSAADIKRYSGKSLPTLTRLAVLHFHAYIRRRDSEGEFFQCISCGQWKSTDQCQATHYMSGGHHSVTRFDPDNVHAGCIRCNHFLSGNLIEYRKRLIEKIGIDRVEAVEMRAKSGTKKIERMDLINVIIHYKNKSVC